MIFIIAIAVFGGIAAAVTSDKGRALIAEMRRKIRKRRAKGKIGLPNPSQPISLAFDVDEKLSHILESIKDVDHQSEQYRHLREELHETQREYLVIIEAIMADCLIERSNREYRLKFPSEIQDELSIFNEQVLYSAEVICRGGAIRQKYNPQLDLTESAKKLVTAFEIIRLEILQQAIIDYTRYSESLKKALWNFDVSWTNYEDLYVGCVVPRKTSEANQEKEEIIILMSEALMLGLKHNIFTQDDVDNFEPSLMFTIPRLSLLQGVYYSSSIPLIQGKEYKIFEKQSQDLIKLKGQLQQLSENQILLLEKALGDVDDTQEEIEAETNLHNLYLDICSISDTIQSGSYTKEFRDVFKAIFLIHQCHPFVESSHQEILHTPEEIEMLITGHVFLKYPRSHWSKTPLKRFVFLTQNLKEIMWCEAGKYNTKKGRDHFLTKDITSIQTDEMSESLAFYQPTNLDRIFTIVTPQRTLDLEAETVELRDQWVTALRKFVKVDRSNNT